MILAKWDKTDKKLLTICIITLSLIVLRGINSFFILPFFIFSLSVLLFAKKEICFPYLMCILPSAFILKFSVEQTSLFTILLLLYVFREFFFKKINTSFILLLLLFGVYCLLNSGFGNLVSIISIILGLLLIKEISLDKEVKFSRVLYCYAFGFITASLIALYKESFPEILPYILKMDIRLEENLVVDRFAGLQVNPNFYALDACIILACIAVNLIKKGLTYIDLTLFLVISFLGLLSLSKSFILVWGLLLLLLLSFSTKFGVKRLMSVLLLFVMIGIVVIYFESETLSSYVLRFEADKQADLSDITTGRSTIWSNYIERIFNDGNIFMFGAGINGPLIKGKGAHNTYIEIFYSLGLLGTLMYLKLLFNSIKLPKFSTRMLIISMPLFILLVRAFAVGIFKSDNFPFYIALIVILFNNYIEEAKNKFVRHKENLKSR